jgi:hypothetical protein
MLPLAFRVPHRSAVVQIEGDLGYARNASGPALSGNLGRRSSCRSAGILLPAIDRTPSCNGLLVSSPEP